MPVKCDACGLTLNMSRQCVNISCPKESPLNWLQFFGSSDALDLDFTKEELGDLVRSNMVRDPADLFMITTADLKLYAKATDARAKNLLNSLTRARTAAAFPRTLYALGIPGISEIKADMIWRKYNSLYDVAAAPIEELVRCGLDMSESEYVVDFFERPEVLELLIRLEGAGIPMLYPAWQRAFAPPQTASTARVGSGINRVRGKHFVFTGKLESMTRAGAEAKVNDLGGYFQSAVNTSTNYLVTGARVGATKTNAARQMGVTVITEREFWEMTGEV